MSSIKANPAAHYFYPLESLRGLAALVVVFYHIWWITPLYDVAVIRNGYLMVDFFFVLSGFVICHSYKDKVASARGFTKFLWLRLGRLYPLHFVLLFVSLGIECLKYLAEKRYGVGPTDSAFTFNNGYSFLSSLLLIQNWGFHSHTVYNAPSWSISAEMAANILFGLLLIVARSARRLIVASVSLVAFSAALMIGGGGLDLGLTSIVECGVFRCILGFFTGVIVYWLYLGLSSASGRKPGQRHPWWDLSSFLFLISSVVLLILKTAGASDFLLLPIVAGLILSLALAPHGWTSRCLTIKPFSWLGRTSYSIYMVHYSILWFFFKTIRVALKAPLVPIPPRWGVDYLPKPNVFVGYAFIIAAVTTVLICSHYSFKWIEEPFRKRSRELAEKWFPKQTENVVSAPEIASEALPMPRPSAT